MDIPLIFLPRHASFHFFLLQLFNLLTLKKTNLWEDEEDLISLQGEQKEYEHGTDSQTTT